MNRDNTKYVGIDLGDKTMMIHVCDEAGEMIEETRLPMTAVAVARKLAILWHKLWISGETYHPFYPAKTTNGLA